MKKGYAFNLNEMIIKFNGYFYQIFPPSGLESGNKTKQFANEIIAHIKDDLSKGQEPVWKYASKLESLKIYNKLEFIDLEDVYYDKVSASYDKISNIVKNNPIKIIFTEKTS